MGPAEGFEGFSKGESCRQISGQCVCLFCRKLILTANDKQQQQQSAGQRQEQELKEQEHERHFAAFKSIFKTCKIALDELLKIEIHCRHIVELVTLKFL